MKHIDIHPLLDKEKQVKAKTYESEKRKISIVGSLLSLLFILFFYFSGLSNYLANINLSFIYVFLIYITIFHVLSTIIGLPAGYYSSYVHEHKWGFSNYTNKTWFIDQLKSFTVSLILLPILLGIFFWVLWRFPDNWWLIAAAITTLISIIFVTLFPVVILPIFSPPCLRTVIFFSFSSLSPITMIYGIFEISASLIFLLVLLFLMFRGLEILFPI